MDSVSRVRGPHGFSALALSLLVIEVGLRLAVGRPYPGATALILAATGLSLLPFLPDAMRRHSLRLATLPALSVGAFSILVTTISVAGIALSEVSVRGASAVLVLSAALVAYRLVPHQVPAREAGFRAREGLVVAGIIGVFAYGVSSAWDIVEPFPPPGSDWAYYLLYAEEVESQGDVFVANPYDIDCHPFSTQPAVGALYGSALMLDGLSPQALARGAAVASSLAPLSMIAAAGTLWGAGTGLVAGAIYVVAPIRFEPIGWHGLAMMLALGFMPLVLLALGLMYRGDRSVRVLLLLGFATAATLVAHVTSAFVVAVWIVAVLMIELLRVVSSRLRAVSLRSRRTDASSSGIIVPVLGGMLVALLIGAAGVLHNGRQVRAFGAPVSHEYFDAHWLSWSTVEYYYSWPFLVLVAVSCVGVLVSRKLLRDGALLGVLSLALAALFMSQLWRISVAFEYRRVTYYLGVALVALVGAASPRLRLRWPTILACLVIVVYLAHISIGLALPKRLLMGADERTPIFGDISLLIRDLDRIDPGHNALLVTDGCLGHRVPYFLRRPTLIAFDEAAAGFSALLPNARLARGVLLGDEESIRIARELGARLVVAERRCTPHVAEVFSESVLFAGTELIVVALPPANHASREAAYGRPNRYRGIDRDAPQADPARRARARPTGRP